MPSHRSSNRNRSGTREWSQMSYNTLKGCRHDCKYCYAKEMALRFGRCKRPAYWRREKVEGNKTRLMKRMTNYVMYPTAHDIQMDHMVYHFFAMDSVLLAGNKVLIVTKPRLEVVKALCKRYWKWRRNILFRFTIGSLKSGVLKFWEPHAPSFEERFAALKHAHRRGFQTSVSSEPFLDRHVERLYRTLKPYITDTFWIGRADRLVNCVRRNTGNDAQAMKRARRLRDTIYQNDFIRQLYSQLSGESRIKWKGQCKKILGIRRQRQAR